MQVFDLRHKVRLFSAGRWTGISDAVYQESEKESTYLLYSFKCALSECDSP